VSHEMTPCVVLPRCSQPLALLQPNFTHTYIQKCRTTDSHIDHFCCLVSKYDNILLTSDKFSNKNFQPKAHQVKFSINLLGKRVQTHTNIKSITLNIHTCLQSLTKVLGSPRYGLRTTLETIWNDLFEKPVFKTFVIPITQEIACFNCSLFTDKLENTYRVAQKTAHYTLVHIFADFNNSFTDVISWKFAIKLLIKIPPHLRCAATLPCEMLMFANHCIPSSR